MARTARELLERPGSTAAPQLDRASVEVADGQRPLQIANGYAHVRDGSGCEWWARYLDPDRSKWVVRP
jgi:hypothetical protein